MRGSQSRVLRDSVRTIILCIYDRYCIDIPLVYRREVFGFGELHYQGERSYIIAFE
jgi:hypothetical protein